MLIYVCIFSWKAMDCFVWMRQNNWINAHSSFCCSFANNSISAHSCHNHMTLAELELQLRPNEAIFVAISLSWIELLETKPYGALLYVILAIQWLWFLDHKLFCDYTCVELWTDTWQPQWSLQAGEGASLRLIYVPIRIKLQAHFRIPRWYGGAVTSLGSGIKDEKEELKVGKWRKWGCCWQRCQ